MDDEKKWDAVVKCDSKYDGEFFYGVKTTKIFCRPSCKSKTPLRENIIYFTKQEEAIGNGFRPCKRCRPDLLQYQPIQELVEKAKNIYDENFTDDFIMKEKIHDLHVTNNHLVKVYFKQYGMTPSEYISIKRIELAKKLLVTTQDTILTIANECGYQSLSTFYDNFNRIVDVSPRKYRRKVGGKIPIVKKEGNKL